MICKDKDKTIEEQNEIIKVLQAKLYGRSSEQRKKPKNNNNSPKKPKSTSRVRLPSEQYPKAQIKEETLSELEAPNCPDCNKNMTDSGLRETSERLELIPMEILCASTEYGTIVKTVSVSFIRQNYHPD